MMAYCAIHKAPFSDVEHCPHCSKPPTGEPDWDAIAAHEIELEDCYECGGEGFIENDCFEDTCCCADPETSHGLRPCPVCTVQPRADAGKGKP
jgi:hypothetical protein